MIALNSITHSVGKAQFKRVLLEDVSWVIKPKQRIVVLGHRHSGARALLDIIGNVRIPDSGWVERRATVSIPGGPFRYASKNDTTYQLIVRMSQIYRVDVKDVSEFLMDALGRHDFLVEQARSLPAELRQQLMIALVYAFPFDFYIFQGVSTAGGTDPRFRAFCEKVFELRTRNAGVLMTASSGKVARRFDGEMTGAVIYRGNLTLYEKLSDAITVFESLPPEEAVEGDLPDERQLASEDADSLFDI